MLVDGCHSDHFLGGSPRPTGGCWPARGELKRKPSHRVDFLLVYKAVTPTKGSVRHGPAPLGEEAQEEASVADDHRQGLPGVVTKGRNHFGFQLFWEILQEK